MLKKIMLFFIAFGLSLNWLAAAGAQDSGVDILDRERARTQPAPLSQPMFRIEEDRQPSPADASIVFTLKSLRVDGATVFTQDQLLSPYKRLYQSQISFETLNALAAELTKKYRDSGYLLSKVVLPAQEVDQYGAEIRLFAIEGFISSVEYQGEPGLITRFKKRFSSVERKLLSKKPLKHKDFEREMLLLQDLPGIEVSSRFQDGAVQSGSILVLEIKSQPVSGSLGWGNSGTDSAGPGIITASLSLDSLPLIGMKTTLSYTQADNFKEYHSITLAESYRFPNGLLLSASFASGRSPEPDTDFARLYDYKTKSNTFNFRVSYPFIRSRDLNLSLEVGYEHRDSSAELLGEHYNRDRLRNLHISSNFDFSDEYGGVTQFITTFTHGLKAFNATNHDSESSNTLAMANYYKIDFYLSRNQQLPYNFSFLVAAEAMKSDRLLYSYNKFSFGGGQFGRGYQSGALEGDNAVAVSFEPRWTYHFGETVAFQPFAFIDYGRVWTNYEVYGVPDSQYGSSVGAGFRLWGHLGSEKLPDFNLSAYWGQQLKRLDDKDPYRFIFQASFYF
ncbi:MAG: hypothetical protein LBE80_10795 [Deltaproteobacteria bacterium]|jgi:hemolysin activation/secretion protein|nr:hypothetical protein [Deltaproteobacteria bacterium]